MKKIMLLAFITILSTNVLFSVDGTPTSIKESVQVQIQPYGAWFTEDEELL